MSWSAKYVWTAGEQVTAAKFNAHITEPLEQAYAYHEDMATLLVTAHWSSTSINPQDWNGTAPLDLEFTKLHDATNLYLLWHLWSYTKSSSDNHYFGVKLGLTSGWPGSGIDYGLDRQRRINQADLGAMCVGGVEVPGLGAGDYTGRLRCKVDSDIYSWANQSFATLHFIECTPHA